LEKFGRARVRMMPEDGRRGLRLGWGKRGRAGGWTWKTEAGAEGGGYTRESEMGEEVEGGD
jgi:hypothetical protein